ncbi:MAG TPA: preprotein translocase subunit YajC [Verrucomicrobiales bacterium]|nr:preprotein translocase subunit YajC [Verrucomicrobiales bacterium]
MMSHGFDVMLAQAAAQGGVPDPRAQLVQTLGMFAIMGVLFYFALFRPQKLKAKELEDRIKSLKPGDKILTNGGIVGTIVNIREKTLSVRSEETKIEVLKSAVSDVTERRAEPAESRP